MANYRNRNTKYADILRKYLQKELDEKGILIPELANKANMDSCALRNYFNGRNDINSGNLIAVMKALGYELQVFNK